MKERIIECVKDLDHDEQVFLALYFHEHLTLNEIKEITGKTPDRSIEEILGGIKDAI